MCKNHEQNASDTLRASNDKEAQQSTTQLSGEGEYVVEKPDPFEFIFTDYVVKPLQKFIPPAVSPNHITLSNVFIRLFMLYNAWLLSEMPTRFSPFEFFARSTFVGSMFLFTEIVDDLDGCHARMTGQCSKLGEVLDHLVDAMGMPILSATVTCAMQLDSVGMAVGMVGMCAMFNLQLVLYQRSGSFVMPPASGPRSSLMGALAIVASGAFIGFLGRTHPATVLYIGAVNVGTIPALGSNCYFYLDRIVQHDRAELQNGKVSPDKAGCGVWCGVLHTVWSWMATILTISAVFLSQSHTGDLMAYFYGQDMVRMQWANAMTPGKWMTPLAYTTVMIGMSFFLNGGMVVHAVLKRPHSNSHPSLGVWSVLFVALYAYQMSGGLGLDVVAAVSPYLCCLLMSIHALHDFFCVLKELKSYNKIRTPFKCASFEDIKEVKPEVTKSSLN